MSFKGKLNSLFVILFFFAGSLCLGVPCYDAWASAYESATATYMSHRDACDGAWFGGDMCAAEADMIYSAALNSAGDAYY